MFNFFFRKSYRLWDNVEIYRRALRTADNNMARAHCKLESKATNTHSEYFLHCNNGCRDASQYYLVRTLGALYTLLTINSGYFLKLIMASWSL